MCSILVTPEPDPNPDPNPEPEPEPEPEPDPEPEPGIRNGPETGFLYARLLRREAPRSCERFERGDDETPRPWSSTL
jgi:hypothetical protein